MSHSKHIHQPATFPRLNYKKKKSKKNSVTQIKRRPFPFRFNAIFNREEEEEVLRYLVAAQSQCLALLQCRGRGAFSENPAGDRYVQFSPPPVCTVALLINSNSLFLRFNKSIPLSFQACCSVSSSAPNHPETRGVLSGLLRDV